MVEALALSRLLLGQVRNRGLQTSHACPTTTLAHTRCILRVCAQFRKALDATQQAYEQLGGTQQRTRGAQAAAVDRALAGAMPPPHAPDSDDAVPPHVERASGVLELMGVAFAALSCQHEAIGCFKRQLSMCATARQRSTRAADSADGSDAAHLPAASYWGSEVRAAAHLQVMYQDVFDQEATEASAARSRAQERDSPTMQNDW